MAVDPKYSITVQGGSSSTGAGAGGWNYSYAALLNRTAGAPYAGLVSNMAHGNSDTLNSALLFSSLTMLGTRVVVWEFGMTDQFGQSSALAWKFWLQQAHAFNVWVIPVLLWNEPPKLPVAGSASSDAVRAAASKSPAVLGIVDLVRLVNDRCLGRPSCPRNQFISDSHHPNGGLHEYVSSEIRSILRIHGASVALGPPRWNRTNNSSSVANSGELFGLSKNWGCVNRQAAALQLAARLVPAGARTISWTADAPMLVAQPLYMPRYVPGPGQTASARADGESAAVLLGKQSVDRLDRQSGFRVPPCSAAAGHHPFELKTAACDGKLTGMAWRAEGTHLRGSGLLHDTSVSALLRWTLIALDCT